jgi:hypothetical protein
MGAAQPGTPAISSVTSLTSPVALRANLTTPVWSSTVPGTVASISTSSVSIAPKVAVRVAVGRWVGGEIHRHVPVGAVLEQAVDLGPGRYVGGQDHFASPLLDQQRHMAALHDRESSLPPGAIRSACAVRRSPNWPRRRPAVCSSDRDPLADRETQCGFKRREEGSCDGYVRGREPRRGNPGE